MLINLAGAIRIIARGSASAILLMVSFTAAGQTIEVQPKTIEAGGEATLTWDSSGASGYITGIGKVIGTGVIQVHAWRPTTYWLVVDGPDRTKVASAKLDATGVREATLWLPSEFPHGKPRQVAGIRLIPFMDTAFKVLIDSWKADDPQWTHDPHTDAWTLYTKKFVVPTPPSADESNVGARRMALSITAHDPSGGELTYEISAHVEFRRAGNRSSMCA